MTTLHEVTSGIKFFVKWTAIISAAVILFIIIFNLGKGVKEIFYPTPPPPATLDFGKLPKITFPQGLPNKDISYSLNTLTGQLPVFPDRVKIFRTEKPTPNLLGLERAKKIVEKIGFISSEKTITDTKYEWVETDPVFKKIDYDILSYDFNFNTDFYSNPYVVSGENLFDENDAIEKSQTFLNVLSSFPSDLDTKRTKTKLYDLEGTQLIPATSLSKTKIIRVDFFQQDIDNLPVYYNNPNFSNIYTLVGGGRNQSEIIEATFLHDNISSNSATYYIKKPEEAFSDLKNGKGYIPTFSGSVKNVSITNIFLAYYLPDFHQDYLMPIIVFEGNNDFTAYISAIKENLLK